MTLESGGERCDLSLRHYQEILDQARKQGYEILSFSALGGARGKRTLVLRHDVDVSVERAVVMARIEAEQGVQPTYFVRLHARYYDVREPSTKAALEELGTLAELGLHYERLYYAQIGEEHLRLLGKDTDEFRGLTGRARFGCAAHLPGVYPPFEEEEVQAAGLAFEAYAPAFTKARKYLSDSSNRWREGCLCTWLGRVDHLTVLIHPVWWTQWPEPASQVIERLRAGD